MTMILLDGLIFIEYLIDCNLIGVWVCPKFCHRTMYYKLEKHSYQKKDRTKIIYQAPYDPICNNRKILLKTL